MTDVLIVNAPNDPGYSTIGNDSMYHALAPLTLGTWLQKSEQLQGIEVAALDGQTRTMSNLEEEIARHQPTVLAISTVSTAYANALQLSRWGKERGAATVMGNDHARDLAHQIIRHRPEVDYVIGHEYGEKDLEKLVAQTLEGRVDPTTIPTLTWRGDDGEPRGFSYSAKKRGLTSITNKETGYGLKRLGSLDIFPIPDRTLYPDDHWEFFLDNYLAAYAHLHTDTDDVTGVTTMNRLRGCTRFANPCDYCDLELDISTSSPEMFWKEVRTANEQVGANTFFEVCDSFTSFYNSVIPDIVAKKPNDLGFEPMFFVYGQARELVAHPEMIPMLKRLGVYRMNVGIDSLSQPTLSAMKQGSIGNGRVTFADTVNNNMAALHLLKAWEIPVYTSFVLGSHAETPETLRKTEEGIYRLIDMGLVADVEIQPYVPLPSNGAGMRMAQAGLLETIGAREAPDWPLCMDDLARAHIERFTQVGWDDVIATVSRVRAYAKAAGLNTGSGLISTDLYT